MLVHVYNLHPIARTFGVDSREHSVNPFMRVRDRLLTRNGSQSAMSRGVCVRTSDDLRMRQSGRDQYYYDAITDVISLSRAQNREKLDLPVDSTCADGVRDQRFQHGVRPRKGEKGGVGVKHMRH